VHRYQPTPSVTHRLPECRSEPPSAKTLTLALPTTFPLPPRQTRYQLPLPVRYALHYPARRPVSYGSTGALSRLAAPPPLSTSLPPAATAPHWGSEETPRPDPSAATGPVPLP
jgi:hypothetical protein